MKISERRTKRTMRIAVGSLIGASALVASTYAIAITHEPSDRDERLGYEASELEREAQHIGDRYPLLFASPDYFVKRNTFVVTSKGEYVERKLQFIGDQIIAFKSDVPEPKIKELQERIAQAHKDFIRWDFRNSPYAYGSDGPPAEFQEQVRKEITSLRQELTALASGQFDLSDPAQGNKGELSQDMLQFLSTGQYMISIERMQKVVRELQDMLDFMCNSQ